MALSKGTKVVLTKTSALAPGYAMNMFTRGGAMSGNWDTGNEKMANIPKKTTNNDITIAKVGLLIKVANMDFKF